MMVTIICCQCKKPIERFVVMQDVEHMCQVIIAYCHGEKDRMSFPDSFIHENPQAMKDIQNGSIEGSAFRVPCTQKATP